MRAADARAEPLHRRQPDGVRAVVVAAQPGARRGAAAHRRVGEQRQRLDRPLVALLVRAGPRVGEHVVARLVQLREQPVVLQLRGDARGERRCQRDDAGLVREQAVGEELGEPLPVQRAAVAAALVQLVHHAPGTAAGERRAVAVGDAEVRPAQPVLAQVLPGAGEQHDLGALVRRQRVEFGGDARRERQVARHRFDRRPPRLAGLPGLCAADGADHGGGEGHRQQCVLQRAHGQRIRSL